MHSLNEYLDKIPGAKLLAIFPHPDDESFLSGGLFQMAKLKYLHTTLICLTMGGAGQNALKNGYLKQTRAKELEKACGYLGVDEVILQDFPDAGLRQKKSAWKTFVASEIKRIKPDIIVTFDHSGITGHPDHIVTCAEILTIVKKMKKHPALFWRVPEENEKKFFKKNSAMVYASSPSHILTYGIAEAVRQLMAIFSHRSQIPNFLFRLLILEWFLLDHKEPYYLVDLKKKYKYKFVYFKID